VSPLPGRGAVIAVPTGEEDVTAAVWKIAFDAGVYCNAVAYPAVPRGRGVLRLSVMATHTDEQLQLAAEVVGTAVQQARAVLAGDPASAVA
jgi:8-amino-7-oxononanoate synthase